MTYLFYNNDLGECYFTISACEDDAWCELADCFGCEYTAANIDLISKF